ncbi:hypothetical protein NVIRPANT_00226 [Pantoea sp. Nvir]|nr:hypothetical protein NVIRPANT_00226 [Pantoea sp. Nvir]
MMLLLSVGDDVSYHHKEATQRASLTRVWFALWEFFLDVDSIIPGRSKGENL